MRLLVIEDERKTGEYLRKGLEESGFVVDVASNGVDGLHLATEGDYDLVVIDVMLPRLDGWGVVKQLRSKKRTPVLFLTAFMLDFCCRGRSRLKPSRIRPTRCPDAGPVPVRHPRHSSPPRAPEG